MMKKTWIFAFALLCLGSAYAIWKSGAVVSNAQVAVTVKISAVGDCTLGNDIKQAGIKNCFNNIYDENGYDFFFQNVRPLFASDDLTIVNLEGTLTDVGVPDANKKWRFRGKPEYTKILTGSFVEAVSFSNNHCRDYGPESYADTIKNLQDAGLIFSSEEITAIKNINGIKVGLASVNSAFRRSDEQQDKEFYNTELLKQLISKDIEQLKKSDVALIIINLHFGIEQDKNPSAQQIELAHYAIDNGADVVLGHHPHVLQPVEYYKGSYIVYSLANFCFGGNTNPKNRDTIIWQQTFYFSDGKRVGQDASIIPCLISSEASYNNYQPVIASGSDYTRIINKMKVGSRKYGVFVADDGKVMPIIQ